MKLQTAIIGVGYWGMHYVRLLRQDSRVDLAVVCDMKEENLDKVRSLYPDQYVTQSISELIYGKVEAVVVCTPVHTHYKIAKSLLLAKRHILCEKAFTNTEIEAQELIDIAASKSVNICVGHTFEYNSIVQKIKQLLDQKALGEVRYIYAQRTGKSPVRSDCNSLIDLSTHDISMILYWLNDEVPIECVSFGQSYLSDNLQDVTFTNIRFEKNIIANLHASWMDHVKQRKVTIIGTKNMLLFDDIAQTLTIYHNGGIEIPNIQYGEPLKNQVTDFIDSIVEGREPIVNGQRGLNVVRVLNKCQETLNERHRIKNTVLG